MSRLAKLAAAATPGPWKVLDSPHDVGADTGYVATADLHRDAAYIAAASPDVVLAMDRVAEAIRTKYLVYENGNGALVRRKISDQQRLAMAETAVLVLDKLTEAPT
jgi:hypothetical protein